ncbi:MAG: hypothetical protein HYW79_00180 [Parcubacteria group bacterium]|nr:hypothetical protein [Parcubacteria group bacterium]
MNILKAYLGDFKIKIILILSVVLNAGLFMFFYFFIKQSNVPIVLHYNVNWGVDYFGEVKDVFTLPVIGFLILFFNTVLAVRLWFKSRILSYFITAIILISQIFLVLSGIALYLINR